jgi:dTMP kinase
MSGKFIIFEGGEGSGKTIQIKTLAKKLQKKGKKVIITREPGSTVIAEKIRQVILYENQEKLEPKAELFLFLASRAQHVNQKIIPALKKGCIIICDRFSASTLAYQVGARNLPNEKLIKQMDLYARDNIQPDIVLYLDVDPKIGLQRKIKSLRKLTRLDKEKILFHQRVRQYFRKMAKKEKNWYLINANESLKENEKDIYEIINKKIR